MRKGASKGARDSFWWYFHVHNRGIEMLALMPSGKEKEF
jgi:hypothetical protein